MKRGFVITTIGEQFAVLAGELKTCNEADNGNIHVSMDVNVWDKEAQQELVREVKLTLHDGNEDWQKQATRARKAKLGVGSFIICYVKYTNAEQNAGFINRFMYPGRTMKLKYQKDDEMKELNIVSGYVNFIGRRDFEDRTSVWGLIPDKTHYGYDSSTVYFSDKIAENAQRVFNRENGRPATCGIFVCGAEKERKWVDQEANEKTACTYTAFRFYTIRDNQ